MPLWQKPQRHSNHIFENQASAADSLFFIFVTISCLSLSKSTTIVSFSDRRSDNHFCHFVFQIFLDGTLQRTCTELNVITLKKSKETMDSLLNASCRFAVRSGNMVRKAIIKGIISAFRKIKAKSINEMTGMERMMASNGRNSS